MCDLTCHIVINNYLYNYSIGAGYLPHRKAKQSFKNNLHWHSILLNQTILETETILFLFGRSEVNTYFANHLRLDQSERTTSTIHLCGIC